MSTVQKAEAVTHKPGAGLVLREREPLNLESPFDTLDSYLTPNDLFYVRNHFAIEPISAETFALTLGGAVAKPGRFSLGDLQAMPQVRRTATLECAGNSRVFLVPQVAGAQWQLGGISTAEWTGVSLGNLLDEAGVGDQALEVVLEGADSGVPKEPPVPAGGTPYARSVSIAVARNTVLALAMNGEPLPHNHGFPVRAIVPGHYGMASVKWLTGIHVVLNPFQGYWQTSDYAYWDQVDGIPVRRPLGPMTLKSVIAQPATCSLVQAGSEFLVRGAAWAGATPIAMVELSTDGGATWNETKITDPAQFGVWQRWQYRWQVPATLGVVVLLCRATDQHGESQPQEHDRRYGSYVIRHTFPVEVVVR